MIRVSWTHKSDLSVFDGDRVVRNLAVVVDVDTVSEVDELGIDGLLFGGLRRSTVLAERYSDAGPHSDAPTIAFPHHDPIAQGWVTVTPHPNETTTHAIMSAVSETGYKHQAVWNGATESLGRQLAASDASSTSVEADALLLTVVQELGSDLLITRRSSLLGFVPRGNGSNPLVVAPEEAVAIVGLFLRSQGKFEPTLSTQFGLSYNRSHFWSEAVSLFVPRVRDLLFLGSQLDQEDGTSQSTELARAVLRRTGRALARRDAVWRLMSQKQDIDVSEDIAQAVEGVLTQLMGAFDASARLANNVLKLGLGRGDLGWQRTPMRKAIANFDGDLATYLAPDSPAKALVDVVNKLRNAIHGVGLDVGTLLSSDDGNRTFIDLAQDDEAAITAAMKKLGGSERWGGSENRDGSTSFDPGGLVDAAIVDAMMVLDYLTSHLATNLESREFRVPLERSTGLNLEVINQHLRWQLGLD
jgi:hypothetical protein